LKQRGLGLGGTRVSRVNYNSKGKLEKSFLGQRKTLNLMPPLKQGSSGKSRGKSPEKKWPRKQNQVGGIQLGTGKAWGKSVEGGADTELVGLRSSQRAAKKKKRKGGTEVKQRPRSDKESAGVWGDKILKGLLDTGPEESRGRTQRGF